MYLTTSNAHKILLQNFTLLISTSFQLFNSKLIFKN